MDLFWRTTTLQVAIHIVVVLSAYWGFTVYYGPQFRRTPAWSWPFVPDSPLFTLLYAPASLLLLAAAARGRPPSAFANGFAALTAAGLVRVGTWTVFALLFYFDHFFGGSRGETILRATLIAAHGGMVVLGLMLLARMRPLSEGGWAALLAVLLAGDFVDYLLVPLFAAGSGWHLYPNGIPPDPGPLSVLAVVTVTLSFGTVALLRALRGTRSPARE